MTLLLQLAAVWAVLSLVAAAGCSLLFRGAALCAERAARHPVGQPGDGPGSLAV